MLYFVCSYGVRVLGWRHAADKCTVCDSDSCMARVSYRFGWFHWAILSEPCPEEVSHCLLLSRLLGPVAAPAAV